MARFHLRFTLCCEIGTYTSWMYDVYVCHVLVAVAGKGRTDLNRCPGNNTGRCGNPNLKCIIAYLTVYDSHGF
jgi:hypothetical protein